MENYFVTAARLKYYSKMCDMKNLDWGEGSCCPIVALLKGSGVRSTQL